MEHQQYFYYNTKSTLVHWHMETIVHATQANPLVHIPFPLGKTQPVFNSSIQRVLRRPLFCSQPFCVLGRIAQFVHLLLTLAMARLLTPCFTEKISYYTQETSPSENWITLDLKRNKNAKCHIKLHNCTQNCTICSLSADFPSGPSGPIGYLCFVRLRIT